MRVEQDSFSGMKVYPSKGRLFVRGDSKIFRFSSSKNESLFLQRKNPRKIAWTVVYRRVNRKGVSEEVAKKRSRRTVKAQRGVGGLSLADIAARRNQKPEARAAARQAALAAGKQKKAAAQEAKKSSKPAAKAAQPKMGKKDMKAGGKR
ncbi:hypothetical protein P389DRAFT_89334 [Cystobasidium minutum MCA 4210]|uniref:60S ribosomal protein eL24 n=1 Tax=Cystobasidium minutum MCA 4210 TaxID=1397322 RepID=UPI0034CF16EF|eukprot:Transcript_13323.p1 GENE.Transcript_13323~~Transcript_13323.p1  ORF type:complete len:174 (+),score=32.96 Transcript_13323:76-522(+)